MALSEVIMPKTGAEMEEGKIVSWKKQPGERVATGEILLEIETDKATMDVESPATGVLLRSLFAADEKVPATHLIAVIGEGNESAEEIDRFIKNLTHPGPAPVAPAAPPAFEPAAAAAPPASSKGSDQRVKASPLARRLAQEKGIDLAAVQGTGPDGRIEKEDVLRAATTKPAAPVPVTSSTSGEVVPLSTMRKAIARTVVRSKQEIPEFSVTMQMEMGAALRKKNALKAAGTPVSVNDLILFATAKTLAAHPDLNSLLEGDTLRRREINIGFALGTDDGLFLPVVRKADKLSIEEIATVTGQYAAKAEKKQITEEDLTGGTFTVSNLGMFGVESFTAIIVPGQAAILSVGAVVDQLRRDDNGGLTWHPVMAATLTLDHRVADGLAAARFLRDLKAQLNAL
jgi:pyruvate dehydrogenase E2 component (dihydrolipoamide acetyltransferase)